MVACIWCEWGHRTVFKPHFASGHDGACHGAVDTLAGMVKVDREARDIGKGAAQQDAQRQVVLAQLPCTAATLIPK